MSVSLGACLVCRFIVSGLCDSGCLCVGCPCGSAMTWQGDALSTLHRHTIYIRVRAQAAGSMGFLIDI